MTASGKGLKKGEKALWKNEKKGDELDKEKNKNKIVFKRKK